MGPQEDSTDPMQAPLQQAGTLLNQGDPMAAQAICMALLAEHPAHPLALNVLGHTHLACKNYQAALTAFEQAIAVDPSQALHHVSCGITQEYLVPEGLTSHEDALCSYEQAVALQPDLLRAHYLRARILHQMGRFKEAAASYEAVLQLDSNHALAQFHLAALRGYRTPACAPAEYVTGLFQDYADHFDDHLLQKLKYAGPAYLQQQLARHVAPGSYDILDLGCGTGLSGLMFKSWARTLDGVDLSPPMVAQAQKKAIYDALAIDDINHHLAESKQEYDFIMAADVFIYLGELAQTFELVWQRLKTTGYFSFTIETTEQAPFQLKPSRRYGHALTYILQLAQRYDFGVADIQHIVLRTEGLCPLHGYAVLLLKPAALTRIDPSPKHLEA